MKKTNGAGELFHFTLSLTQPRLPKPAGTLMNHLKQKTTSGSGFTVSLPGQTSDSSSRSLEMRQILSRSTIFDLFSLGFMAAQKRLVPAGCF